MKLKDINKGIDILNNYFDKEDKLNFEIAEKLCDLIPKLEEQSKKYEKLLYKFLLDHYNYNSDTNTHIIKNVDQIEFVSNEKEKIDNLEFNLPKQIMPKIKEINPKTLMILRDFFIFE